MTLMVVVALVLNAALLLVLVFRQKQPTDMNSSLLIKQDINTLTESVGKLKDGLQQQLGDRLDRSSEQMMKQSAQNQQIIREITQKLTSLEKTNQQVGDIASELKTLQNVLANPKQRGVLGEFYLKQILENMLPPGAFELQYRLAEGMIVDAIIRLDNKILPIDSKFSLENYNRLVEAKPEDRAALEKAFKDDLKKRIDETAKYIQPKKGTLEQALMFIPSEAIYYDLLANKVGAAGVNGRDFMQYAAVDKRVTIVGPSTLSAMLQIISQGLNSLEIQKDTELIRKNVEQLGRHLRGFDGYMSKLGRSLGATVGHFNSAHKELGRVDKDVVKIAGGNEQIEPLLLDKPNYEEE